MGRLTVTDSARREMMPRIELAHVDNVRAGELYLGLENSSISRCIPLVKIKDFFCPDNLKKKKKVSEVSDFRKFLNIPETGTHAYH